MIDGVLYVTTPYNSIAALDAETGKELWRFDGEAYKLGPDPVRQRMEAARHGVLARRRQAARVPEQPASAVLAGRADRQAGSIVRQQRRGVADRRLAADLATSSTRRKARRRSSTRTSSSSAARCPIACSCPIQSATSRHSTPARASACGRSPSIPQSPKDPGADTWENESWRTNGHAQRLGADGARCGARAALSADVDAEQRLLRRRAARREPVCRVAGLSRCGDRQDEVAFPDGPPRALGLRQSGAAESGHDHRQRPADRRRRAGHQAGIHVRVRSRDRASRSGRSSSVRCRPTPTCPARSRIRRSRFRPSRRPSSIRASRSRMRTT